MGIGIGKLYGGRCLVLGEACRLTAAFLLAFTSDYIFALRQLHFFIIIKILIKFIKNYQTIHLPQLKMRKTHKGRYFPSQYSLLSASSLPTAPRRMPPRASPGSEISCHVKDSQSLSFGCFLGQSNQIKSNQIKSNQIKSIRSYESHHSSKWMQCSRSSWTLDHVGRKMSVRHCRG